MALRQFLLKPPLWSKLLFLTCFIYAVNDLSGFYPSFSTKVQGLVATMILFLFIGSLGRTIYAVFVVLFVTVFAMYYLTLRLYGPITYDLMLSMRFTTREESFGYLSDVLRWGLVVPVFLGTVLSIASLLLSRISISNKYYMGASALALVCLPIVKAQRSGVEFSNKYRDHSIAFSTFPSKLISKAIQDLRMSDELVSNIKAYDAGHDWSAYPAFSPKQVNIIVIGESSRADLYGMNGFAEFDLTPNIDSTYNYNFSQCISPASVTISSLTRTLFLTDDNHNSIPQANLVSLFRSRNVKTFWVSNQGRVGRADSPFAALGMTCDSAIFLNQFSYHTAQEHDTAMLPYIQEILHRVNHTGDQVAIFVHLLGSHPPLDLRFDTLTIPYTKPDMLAHYMQSVHETDAFIGKILNELREFPDHNMFYFSDHGITYHAMGDYFYHGGADLENYHVPLAVWAGKDTNHRTIDQRISLSDLIGLVNCFNQGPDPDLDSFLVAIHPPDFVFGSDNRKRPITSLGSNKFQP